MENLILHRNRIEAAPHIPGRHRAPGLPALRDFAHPVLAERRALVLVAFHGALQSDVVHRKYVGA